MCSIPFLKIFLFDYKQVGSAAAYFESGNFSTRLFFVILASSVLVISWLNLR